MYYLLGTEVIVEISRGIENPPTRWIRQLDQTFPTPNIVVSTLSWAAIELEFKKFEKQTNGLTHSFSVLRQRIHGVFERYRALRSVLPLDDRAVRVWVDHLQGEIKYSDPAGTLRPVPIEERMILATAIAGFQGTRITLVARKELVHHQLEIFGLVVEDPYDGRI